MQAVLVCVCCALPIPDAAAITTAGADIQEVFADDLKAARKPADKAALARKMIDTTRGSRPAARYALLVQARELAIVAGDSVAGVQATEGLAAFTGPSDPAQGHRLWNRRNDLRSRLEATEIYLRALPTLGGFQRAAVEKRLRTLGWEHDMTPAEVAEHFALATWKIKNQTLTGQFGRVHADGGWAMGKTRAGIKSLMLSLEMLTSKDFALRIEVDGVRHTVVFGSDRNTTLTWWSGKHSQTVPFKAADTNAWHMLSVNLRDEKLAFSFDGKIHRAITIPRKQQDGHVVRVGFGHHIGPAVIRRVRLSLEQTRLPSEPPAFHHE